MARNDPALSLRLPTAVRRGGEGAPTEDRPRLRLVVTKGQLGVELDAPFDLGPLRVTELALAFSSVKFPVELSGGVSAFRNRRGTLQRLTVELPAARLRKRLLRCAVMLLGSAGDAPGAAQRAGLEHTHAMVAAIEGGWLIGVAHGERALAFELLVAPLAADVRLLPVAARGVGLGQPAHGLAMRIMAAALKPWGQPRAGAIVLEDAATQLSRSLLPLAGMRAPSASGLRWGTLVNEPMHVVAAAAQDGPLADLGNAQLSALELLELAAEGDAALARGQLADARRAYLAALTRAPRHPALVRRIADLDRLSGERGEAALSLLVDVQAPVDAGALGAELLQTVGERDAAIVAWRRAAEQESYGPLAALCWLRLAQLVGPARDGAADLALAEALARWPDLQGARWSRFRSALRSGEMSVAAAQIQHLEAAASGAHERHTVLVKAADWLFAAGHTQAALEHFERALRFLPSSVAALAGLARSLQGLGHGRRALELFGRALALAERAKQPEHRVAIELAKGLVEVADDRPAAIARLGSVPPFVADTFEARGLEARWRAEIGDLAGAGVALARLAEATELALGPLTEEAPQGPYAAPLDVGADDLGANGRSRRAELRRAIAELLFEGAQIHEIERLDLAAARRLLALALRLAPRHSAIQRSFKRVAAEVDGKAQEAPRAPIQASIPAVSSQSPHTVDVSQSPALRPPRDSSHEQVLQSLDALAVEAEDELLAEQLSEQLRGRPDDHALASKLAEVLERLGRDHELLALLSARIDELAGADDGAERRDEWLGRRRRLLGRMRDAATTSDEASLYQLMLDADS